MFFIVAVINSRIGTSIIAISTLTFFAIVFLVVIVIAVSIIILIHDGLGRNTSTNLL